MGKSIFISGQSAAPGASTFFTPGCGILNLSGQTTEARNEIAFNSAGTLSKLLVRLSVNSSTTSTWTIRKNNVNTSLSVAFGASQTGALEDTTNTVTVAAGDRMTLGSANTGTLTITVNFTSVVFDATTNTQSIFVAGSGSSIGINGISRTIYVPLTGICNTSHASDTTETPQQYEFRKTGSLKRLSCMVSSNSYSSTMNLRTRKNGANGAQTASVGGTATGVFADTTNSDTIAVGDDFCYQLVGGTNNGIAALRNIACHYESTGNDCLQLAADEIGEALASNNTAYCPPAGEFFDLTTEAQCRVKMREACTASSLSCRLTAHSGGPGTIRSRVNGANGSQSITLTSGATGLFQDTSNSDTLTATDDYCYQIVTVASETATVIYVGSNLNFGAGTTPVSETNIHKYNITGNALQTSIQKYNVIAEVLRASIHKYDMLNFVPPATSVHKYNLLQNILQSSIHKYNAIGVALQASIHKYNLFKNIASTSVHKYNLLQNIAQTSIHKYNLLKNILQTSIHKYNLLQNVLQSSIQKYNLLKNILQTSIHKYNLLQYIIGSSIQKYNLLQYILQSSIHKYNLESLAAVLATSIHKYHLFQNAIQTSTHKYNILNAIAATSVHKYHLLQNILQTSIHKYYLLNTIAQTSVHKYNLLKNILQTSIHKYNLFANIAQSSIHKYNLLQNILQTSIHKYNVEVLGAVVNALIAKYNILQYITQPSTHKYNLLKNIAQTTIHKYNLLQNLIANSIQKYNVLQSILLTSHQKYNILQNVIQSSIHKYDVLVEIGTILVNSIHKYDILQTILETSKHKYGILNTVARTSIHKYNILQQILHTSIHKYDMGGIISAQSRHVYNIVREILASSVAGGIARKRVLKTIKYPVYHVEELRKLELRRRLRGTESVVIPAFMHNIHRTIAPFVVTNPVTGRVTVRFAVVNRQEPAVSFVSKQSIPVKIAAKTHRNAANKAKSAHIMQQKAIERYGKRLNKLSKIMTLFFLHEQLSDDN